RCYQSFIVNLFKVSFIRADGSSKTYAIQFAGYDGEVLLSRDNYPELLTLLKEKYANIDFCTTCLPGAREMSPAGRFSIYILTWRWRRGSGSLPLSTSRWSSGG